MTLLDGTETVRSETLPRGRSAGVPQATVVGGSSVPSSGVATVPPVGAEGQTGSAARLIAQLEAEAYGTWQQAFAEVYGR